MATQVPNKLYKGQVNNIVHWQVLPGYNTPFGYGETNAEDFNKNATTSEKATFLRDFGGKSVEELLGGSSGYVVDDAGRFMMQSSLDQENYWKNEGAAGRARNIGTEAAPLWVPRGSAAEGNYLANVKPNIDSGVLNPLGTGPGPNAPLATDVPATIPSKVTSQLTQNMSGTPLDELTNKITQFEINRANETVKRDQLREQLLTSLAPSTAETQLQGDINSLNQQVRELTNSFQAGVDKITGQPIPMQLIIGQAKTLAEQAERQISAVTTAAASLTDQLSLMQTAREARATQLNALMQFMQEDRRLGIEDLQLQTELYNIARQYEMDRRAEANAAKDYALQLELKTPYYFVGQTVYPTNGQPAFTSPEDFLKRTGMTIEQAGQRGLIADAVAQQQIIEARTAARKGTGSGSGIGDNVPTESKVRNFLLDAKRDNPGAPYYDIWGQAADYMKSIGLNPSNYDELFWEILHPEGKTGFEKYKKASANDNIDALINKALQ